jgi:hypothetical protein
MVTNLKVPTTDCLEIPEVMIRRSQLRQLSNDRLTITYEPAQLSGERNMFKSLRQTLCALIALLLLLGANATQATESVATDEYVSAAHVFTGVVSGSCRCTQSQSQQHSSRRDNSVI